MVTSHKFFAKSCIFSNAIFCIQKPVLAVALQRYFCLYAKQPILWYVFFSTFCSQQSSLASFPRKSYLLFLPLGNIIHENVKENFQKLNIYFEKKCFLGKRKRSYKNKTRAAKLSFPLWNVKLLESIWVRANKIPCNKVHISSRKM